MKEPAAVGVAQSEGRGAHIRIGAENLQHVLKQLPVLAWTTDRNLHIAPPLHWCPTGALPQHPASRQHITACFGCDDAIIANHTRALHGSPTAFSFVCDERHYLAQVKPLRDRDGEISGVIGAALDVTDHVLLQTQFHTERKMEMIARLAGGMAHDFNNVLTIIVSYARFLLDRFSTDKEAYEDALVIHDAAQRAVASIAKLLAFSRRQVLRPEVVDLSTFLEQKRAALRSYLPENVGLSLSLSRDACYARVDQEQLLLAISNLVVNSAEAMPQGGHLLIETTTVELSRSCPETRFAVLPGPYVVLAVSDTGVGMTPDIREQIFEPFFSTKKGGRSRGLGLSSTYGIVKQSHGHIRVESQPNQGTTFTVYLPRVENSFAPALHLNSRSSQSSSKPTEPSRTREAPTDAYRKPWPQAVLCLLAPWLHCLRVLLVRGLSPSQLVRLRVSY